jgi:hypothetical protein
MTVATKKRFTRAATILASSLVMLLVSHARASADAHLSRSCLVLEWMDPHELLPTGERWVATETLRILEGADIGARWDWSERATNERREHRLRVVLVPSEPSGPGWRLSPHTLGATVTDGVEAPPAVYIFYKSVAATLGFEDGPDHRNRVRAARALGRIVAHELAHAIVPFEPHASEGLMRGSLEPRFLTANNAVSIDPRWRRILHRHMSQLCSDR